MTARDRFIADLKCPNCGREGQAHLSELDGWSYAKGDKTTKVDSLPEGFHSVDRPSFYGTVDTCCDTCNVSALTK